MTEFPRIMAILPPFALTAMTGQSSYPLNSANASPPGICRVYLSCAEMALPPKTTTAAAMIKIAEKIILFMTLSRAWRLSAGSVQPEPVQCTCDRVQRKLVLKGGDHRHQPQFQTGPIGRCVQHGPKLPPL